MQIVFNAHFTTDSRLRKLKPGQRLGYYLLQLYTESRLGTRTMSISKVPRIGVLLSVDRCYTSGLTITP